MKRGLQQQVLIFHFIGLNFICGIKILTRKTHVGKPHAKAAFSYFGCKAQIILQEYFIIISAFRKYGIVSSVVFYIVFVFTFGSAKSPSRHGFVNAVVAE